MAISPAAHQQASRKLRTRRPARVLTTQGLLQLVVAGVAAFTGVAIAATPSPEIKDKCGSEMRSLCLRPWRLTPDSITACISENQSRLSPVCQGFWRSASACQLEMRQVCGGLSPLTIKQCLTGSGDKFSESCRQFLDLQ